MNVNEEKRIVCTGCGCCACICPKNAISMKENSKGFPRPHIEKTRCINCGMCIQYCPQHRPQNNGQSDFGRIDYYGWSGNRDNHFAGTSGGIFPEIAKHHLSKDGVVFGAIWTNDFREVLICSSDDVALEKMLKSKYVFSNATDSYKKVIDCIKNERKVLYCGTPCQISALLSVIEKEQITTDGLITCDFICGGLPSKRFWQEHLDIFKEKYGPVAFIDFRSKIRGWKHAVFEIKFKNGKKIIKRSFTDSYYNCFSDMHISVQQSCNECKYRTKHLSDFTLADFWEYKKAGIPINNEGLSLFFINTDKGEEYVKGIPDLELYPIDKKFVQYAFKGLESPENRLKKQIDFFNRAEEIGFEKAAAEVAITTWSGRIMIHIKKILSRFDFWRSYAQK